MASKVVYLAFGDKGIAAPDAGSSNVNLKVRKIIPDRTLQWKLETEGDHIIVRSVTNNKVVFDVMNELDVDNNPIGAWGKKSPQEDRNQQFKYVDGKRLISNMDGKRAVTINDNDKVVLLKNDPNNSSQDVKLIDAQPDVTLNLNNKTNHEVSIIFTDRANNYVTVTIAPGGSYKLVAAQGAHYAPVQKQPDGAFKSLVPLTFTADQDKTVDITDEVSDDLVLTIENKTDRIASIHDGVQWDVIAIEVPAHSTKQLKTKKGKSFLVFEMANGQYQPDTFKPSTFVADAAKTVVLEDGKPTPPPKDIVINIDNQTDRVATIVDPKLSSVVVTEIPPRGQLPVFGPPGKEYYLAFEKVSGQYQANFDPMKIVLDKDRTVVLRDSANATTTTDMLVAIENRTSRLASIHLGEKLDVSAGEVAPHSTYLFRGQKGKQYIALEFANGQFRGNFSPFSFVTDVPKTVVLVDSPDANQGGTSAPPPSNDLRVTIRNQTNRQLSVYDAQRQTNCLTLAPGGAGDFHALRGVSYGLYDFHNRNPNFHGFEPRILTPEIIQNYQNKVLTVTDPTR